MLRPDSPRPTQAVPTAPEHRRTLASQRAKRGLGKHAEDGDKSSPAADTAGTRDVQTVIRGMCATRQTGRVLHQEAAGPKRPLTPAGGVNCAH